MPLLKDSKLIEQWEEQEQISVDGLSSQYAAARDDHQFHSGDEMAYTATVEDKGQRSAVVFNRVKPFVDAVNGFMVQLRRKAEYQARITDSEKQQLFSSYMNDFADYARKNANMDTLEARQNREMLITGYGAIDTNVIYTKNPDGEVAGENIRFSDVGWDPQAAEANLLDARWVYRRKKFNRDEALKRFKGSKPEDFESYDDDRDTSFFYNPFGGEYDKIGIGSQQTEDLVEVYYYQWWDLEKYYRMKNPLFEIEDPATASLVAEMMERMRNKRKEVSTPEEVDDLFEFDPFDEFLVMTPKIRGDMTELFKRFNVEFDAAQEFLKKVYYTAILSGTTIFQKFKSPDQQGFTIKFKTGTFDPTGKVWYGMVASLKEPAKYSNKSLTEILYVIASNSKGGVMYEESAVEDPVRFEQQFATTKAAVRVADGALSGGKIQPKAQAALPSGYENVLAISNKALEEVSGIHKEFFGGSENKQVSALLEAQRINQVISTLADYFDSISLYQVEHARLMTTYIRILAQNSEGRLISIIGPEGALRYEELSEDRMVDEYDVDIAEAPTSATQKQESAAVIMQFADKVAAFGQNVYPLVVDYLPIKHSDKQKLRDALTPDPQETAQQQQIAQQQAADQKALQDSIIEGQKANAAKDIATAQKTMAQIPNEVAERDETRANTVKTLAEAQQKTVENEVLKSRSITGEDIRVVI